MPSSLPTRALPAHPDLDQLRRQAKDLLDDVRLHRAEAIAEVNAHYHDADLTSFALHDAQLVIARAYGYQSWPKLKAFVEGATAQRFVEAVRSGDFSQVRAMLQARPELAGSGLHAAVVERASEVVRLLMRHGANARTGIYPHRDATSALTIATERGYEEIVGIIREEEQKRQLAKSGVAARTDGVFEAIQSGDDDRAIALLEADSTLVQARQAVFDWTPLLLAAHMLNVRLVTWLLDHGADPNGRGRVHPFDDIDQRPRGDAGQAPLDAAAARAGLEGIHERFRAVANLLVTRGADMTARAAVAFGNAEWLRAWHAQGRLTNPTDESGGVLRIAVSHNRPEILEMLLEFGFDPDERTRFRDVGPDGVVFTWGMPLAECARTRKYAMADMLLKRGADPNASLYASGDPVFWAFSEGDTQMVKLLEQYGGIPTAGMAASFRQTELARKMLAGEAPYRLDSNRTLAEELLDGAACGGDPEIVRVALDRVDWPRSDPRWFGVLEQPLRLWAHGRISTGWDRTTYVTCFRLLLQRCDPTIRGRNPQLGLTILHSIAGSRQHMTADERIAFATLALDAGASLNVRDNLLRSTPLGWACRWGREELVELFLARGADPIETDAEPWATPLAWARKKGHTAIARRLEGRPP